MAGVAADVKMGPCTVTFGGADLGYTSGGVKVSYKAETKDITVDQEDTPVGIVVTGQSIEVTIPLAEQNLERLAGLLPGATFVQGTPITKIKMVLSGEAGVNLTSLAKKLVITPLVPGDVSSNEVLNGRVTLHKAIPLPNIEFSYDKDKQRVYEVTFRGIKGTSGFVTFGDETAGT